MRLKSNLTSVYYLLHSVAGFSSSSSSSFNFPTVPLPGSRLRSLCRLPEIPFFCLPARGFAQQSQRLPFRTQSSHVPRGVSFVLLLPLPPAEFLAAATNLSSTTATSPDKVAYPMLKHLPRSGMNLLPHIFNVSWSLHSCSSSERPYIIPIHKMGKPLNSLASFRPIFLTSCVSKLYECIILSRLLFFLESNFILSPLQAGFRHGRSTLDQILFLSHGWV